MSLKNNSVIGYEVDPHNRLVAIKTMKDSGITTFRETLEGKFSIGRNLLFYHLKKSSRLDTPQQIKLTGEFSLDKEHRLNFTLDKWGNQVFSNRLILKTEIMDVRGNEVSFSLITKDKDKKTQFYILKLAGTWSADKFNRLRFDIEKENAGRGNLTFMGSWEVNNNELIYSYSVNLKEGKRKIKRTLVFKGFWSFADKFRLVYCLNKATKSLFDFEVGLARYSLNELVYEVGIGPALEKREFSLRGSWKINRNLGLIFEMLYANGQVFNINFGATCRLGGGNKVELELKNLNGDDLGVELKLSRELFKDAGEVFLKSLSSRKELSICAGAGFKW